MASQVSTGKILLSNYGPTVARAAQVLPATATTTYFNIVGGQVLITSIFGVVTTVTTATATTLTVNAVNTAGAATVALGTATSVASLAVGTIIAIPTIGGALTTLAYGTQNNEFSLGAGQIQMVTSATNTGATKWYLNYLSLDPGAYVAAA